ncbi:uncharacterized protein SPPG_08149 [Spizellomyces punctatus DAOM BR117]|uniref:Endoglucanase n=1 Tax=Spizellomyces punctatus (strain DAOM BR117) TaxID=645134 RepID=A0A0L0H5U4_SPIPD|nr:uncharacterized protein SPPG_08149 [Spizellomyces punctatus DAOM BR117]KNC96562.1 hypothetical protein SPPG_08149 [Spizellomyces punctatus DAOM BR117]|eukprot:XP_016604602.1 hypothetical protein SPPG_08149 [Spizellomyces punctatus DAOM BR117]
MPTLQFWTNCALAATVWVGTLAQRTTSREDSGTPAPINLITPPGPIVDSATYVAPAQPKYDYVDVIHKSYLFYWAQRSGKLPYQRLAWRSDSCLDCRGQYGEDLSGGWYEAANTMKWGGPFGFTAFQLAWNVLEYGDALKQVNEYKESIDWVRQGAEYLLNVYSKNATHERLVGVYGVSAVGATDIDFGYFGPPEEYLQWVPLNFGRRAFYCEGSATLNKGCSDIAGDYASALAAASLALKPVDEAFAARCLEMAKTIYDFAMRYLNSYNASVFDDFGWANYKQWYPSYGYYDELSLASVLLHLATNDATYLTQSQQHLAKIDGYSEYSWSDKGIAAAILLHKLTKDAALATTIRTFFTAWLPGGKVKRTPRGLVFYMQWGALRYATNVAFIALVHADFLEKNAGDQAFVTQLRNFAVQQINYILGDCGRSWIPGFGENYPKLPYHKGSYNAYIDYPMRGQSNNVIGDDFLTSTTPNRFILYGALVGGPEATDAYVDNRQNYEYTEVTQDYNAAFTGALAGLVSLYGPSKFKTASDCELDLGWKHPNATKQPTYPAGDCYHTCQPCAPGTTTAPGGQTGATGSSSTPGSGTAAKSGAFGVFNTQVWTSVGVAVLVVVLSVWVIL